MVSTTSVQEDEAWSKVLIKDLVQRWSQVSMVTGGCCRWVWCLGWAPQPWEMLC